MSISELEDGLKKVVAYRDSEDCHALQEKNFELYLAVCAAGNVAELALRLIANWLRHDAY